MSIRILALFLLLAVGCSGPFAYFPGAALEGEVKPVPADWAFAGDYGLAQLETKPAEPYSVNIAYTIMDGGVYINAGDTETQWVQNMNVDPNVRLRVDDVIYEMTSERITDEQAIASFGKAWTAQSTFRRDTAELEEVWLYRLSRR